jgi:hypothetical protein
MLPPSPQLREHLSRFGPQRHEWEGQGLLPVSGQDPIPVSFLIGQRSDGRLVFACESSSPELMHSVIEDRIPSLQEAALSLSDGSAGSIEGNSWVVHTSTNISRDTRNTT